MEIVLPAQEVERQLDFGEIFGWPPGIARPVEIEIGCGKGRFLVSAAAQWSGRDFVAIEQVRALVRKVRDRVSRLGLANARLVHGNAKDVLTRLVPDGAVSRVHVYFPDPWPKRRHAKHRLFADPIPDVLARVLAPGGQVLLATDHDPYFREVVARFQRHEAFVRVLPDVFGEIPRGGFDAIFAAAGVPIFRGCWERRKSEAAPSHEASVASPAPEKPKAR